ncbi:MAG: hypothetical protein QOF60_2715 [Actinomycetota bacterium]|jgi:hypothetical protein|nr:hypothetical protein [Actinomycetota bacterium]
MGQLLKPGLRLRAAGDAELIVVRPPSTEVELACSGSPLTEVTGTEAPSTAAADGEPIQLGKRYVDTDSGVELLCTRAGSGLLTCDGRAMTIKGAKPLPSSD